MNTKRNWFRVEVQIGHESYFFTGSVEFSEAEMLEKLTRGEFLTLEELVYVDEDGTVRPWTEWDPECQPRISLNGRSVLSVMPLVGDPRRPASGTGSILRMPGGRPGQSPPPDSQ